MIPHGHDYIKKAIDNGRNDTIVKKHTPINNKSIKMQYF